MIPKVDLIHKFKEVKVNLEDLFFDNCHFTPLGHQIVADEIYRSLLDEGLLFDGNG